jgi:hypothetical protein
MQGNAFKALQANHLALQTWQHRVTGTAALRFSFPLSKHHLHFYATPPCVVVS